MKIQGAIFDMDGLLLDTEAQSMLAWPEVGITMGYTVTREMILAIMGCNYPTGERIMKGFLGEDLDYAKLYHRSCDRIFERMREQNMPLRPYAREILENLRNSGCTLALATSTNRDLARTEMKEAGLLEYFQVFCFGDEVMHGKPAPDIFFLAAERLGLRPEQCAVLEDSPNGILAALSAGMTGLWIPDQITAEMRPDIEEKATRTFPTLKEASEYLLCGNAEGSER